METTLTITEARRDLSKLIDRLRRRRGSAIITRSGKPVARVTAVGSEPPKKLTAGEFAEVWKNRPRLEPDDAAASERDIMEGRALLNLPPVSKWD